MYKEEGENWGITCHTVGEDSNLQWCLKNWERGKKLAPVPQLLVFRRENAGVGPGSFRSPWLMCQGLICNNDKYGSDWLLWWEGAGIESRSRMVRCMLKLYTDSCLVVSVVGPVWDDILFGCMHGCEFWVYDTWVPAPCLNQAILHGEGSINWEDEVMRDGGGQMNERIQAKDTKRTTKHTAWTRSDI